MQPPIEHHASVCVLAPAYQRVREMETLLKDPRLHTCLPNDPVRAIERTPTGFIITSEQGVQFEVLIHYHNVATYGPIGFKLEFPDR